MRSFSVKSSLLALALALTLTATSPAIAAARQDRERTRNSGPIQRIVQVVKRIIGLSPNDEVIIPHPAPETNRP